MPSPLKWRQILPPGRKRLLESAEAGSKFRARHWIVICFFQFLNWPGPCSGCAVVIIRGPLCSASRQKLQQMRPSGPSHRAFRSRTTGRNKAILPPWSMSRRQHRTTTRVPPPQTGATRHRGTTRPRARSAIRAAMHRPTTGVPGPIHGTWMPTGRQPSGSPRPTVPIDGPNPTKPQKRPSTMQIKFRTRPHRPTPALPRLLYH